MQILPVDLTSLVAVVLGIMTVLIPIAGLTARFALKPTVEALSRLWEHKGIEDTVGILERRMTLLEQQMETMEGTMRRLADAADFHRELQGGARPAVGPGPRSPTGETPRDAATDPPGPDAPLPG